VKHNHPTQTFKHLNCTTDPDEEFNEGKPFENLDFFEKLGEGGFEQEQEEGVSKLNQRRRIRSLGIPQQYGSGEFKFRGGRFRFNCPTKKEAELFVKKNQTEHVCNRVSQIEEAKDEEIVEALYLERYAESFETRR
jgi:hypothetical protein